MRRKHKMPNKKLSRKQKENVNLNISVNKKSIIAAILNLILVGLGYAFLKKYKKAVLAFVVYVIAYFIIFYISTYYPILIWLGIPITLFFVYDAYKTGERLYSKKI